MISESKAIELLEKYCPGEKREAANCWCCGKAVMVNGKQRQRFMCDTCAEKHLREHEEKVNKYADLKVEIMHETAIRTLERSRKYVFDDLKEDIEFARQIELAKRDSFMSSQEIVAAIVLLHEGIVFKPNKKILKYKIDFYIEEEKILLEIDSNLHELGNRRATDGRRDVELRLELGPEWETVRISGKYVEKYPDKLVKAMRSIKRKQQELRAKNGGMLPRHYSKATKAYYDSIFC